MTPEQLSVAISIVRDIALTLFGTGGILYILLKRRAEHQKSQDDDTHIKTQGEIDKEKRVADLAAAEAAAATEERKTQAALIERLLIMYAAQIEEQKSLTLEQKHVAQAIEASTAEQKIGHSIEADRLVSHDKAEAAWRTSIQDLTAAVVGFQSSMATTGQNISQGIAAAQSATIDAIGTKVDDMGTDITSKLDETSKGVVAIRESFQELTQTLTTILMPMPDQLAKVEAAVDKLNRQVEVVNQQITDLRHEIAVDKSAGVHTAQTDADHAANVQADKAAFDGPPVKE